MGYMLFISSNDDSLPTKTARQIFLFATSNEDSLWKIKGNLGFCNEMF
jgi:hypothetical protein